MKKKSLAPSRIHETEIHIEREALKFSSAHMTVFPDGTKEALHGHNYQTAVTLSFKGNSPFQTMIPFSKIKKQLKSICDHLDEKILIPKKCPFLKEFKSERKENIAFELCGTYYSLPLSECHFILTETITCESLSEYVAEQMSHIFTSKDIKTYKLNSLKVSVFESPKQGASSLIKF